MKNTHEIKPEDKRITYDAAPNASALAELDRMRAALAAALRSFEVNMLRLHADAARIQCSQYYSVTDDMGGGYSVSFKVTKESQRERVTARAASDAAAQAFAEFATDYAIENGRDSAKIITAQRAALCAKLADRIVSGALRMSDTAAHAEYLRSLV